MRRYTTVIVGLLTLSVALPTIAFSRSVQEGWESENGVLKYGVLGEMTVPYGNPQLALYCLDDGSLYVVGHIIDSDVGGARAYAEELDRLSVENAIMRLETPMNNGPNDFSTRASGRFIDRARLAPMLVGGDFLVIRAMNKVSSEVRTVDDMDMAVLYPAPSSEVAEPFLARCASVSKVD